MERYPSGVVPAQDVLRGHDVQNPQPWRDVLPVTIDKTLRGNFMTCDLTPVLSHLAVASASSAPRLTPTLSAPNSFGALLVVMPTSHRGGQVTFNVKGFSTPMAAIATSASYAAVHRGATILMSPVTAGHVVIAVFDLVGKRPLDEAPPLSPEFEATVAALVDAAAAPAAHSMIGFAVRPEVDLGFFDLSHHTRHDGAFLAALLESKVFDVALVVMRPCDEVENAPLEILHGTMHPALGLAPDAMKGCCSTWLPAFLGDVCVEELARPRVKTCLVFWPTAHRSRALGADVAVFSLGSIADAGLRRQCVEDALDVMDHTAPQDFLCDGLGPYDGNGGCFFRDLGRGLNDVGDGGLVARFWTSNITQMCDKDRSLFASTVHRALELFGADALMPALEALLSGMTTSWFGFASGVRLLAGLAGVSDNAVCLRLPLARVDELRLYTALFAEPPSQPRYMPGECCKELLQATLLDAVRLEAYLGDGAMPSRLAAIVAFNTREFHPWTVLAPVVLTLAPARLTWCDELLRATATTCEVPWSPSDRDVANVLRALDAMDALDVPTFKRLMTMPWRMPMVRREALKGVAVFFSEVADAAPRFLAHVPPANDDDKPAPKRLKLE
ncbi:hypothetical protein SPRG_03298 [Saprolegnia parasitica CBS 223.65]|uniref:Uncharacterized protein n=1 Tax=Saprolegnia parasitica (strain CBS 223.65) TaxID=695850 RepID=A0A067CN05_SAPPC|nr:hypothetical protein SPRG_03298 [Saprolegnia parasitica CBS 223.65]KDO32079.1 hypothetical protein SPRG_03298 [Saprolegnia parasitica CBS 223.65]|eukprot:XP_012197267.1 hypothetical protein SPRG_03298 [Saprolegnia parasitica CBS 223.65]